LGIIPENLGKIPEKRGKNGGQRCLTSENEAQHLQKNKWSMVNGQWFIVSYDSANKQKHHKSHRMQ